MRQRLPSPEEIARILSEKRTRPAPRPAPPRAGRALGAFIKTLDARFGKSPGALLARWPEIVGEDLARICEPMDLIRPRRPNPLDGPPPPASTLKLKVSGAHALILQHRQQEILDRVNLFLGQKCVDRINLVQGPIAQRVRPLQARSLRQRPLDAATEAALKESVQDAPNDRIGAALLKLGRAVLLKDQAQNSATPRAKTNLTKK